MEAEGEGEGEGGGCLVGGLEKGDGGGRWWWGGDWRGGRRLMEGWRPIGCGKEGCGARLDGEGRLEGRGVEEEGE